MHIIKPLPGTMLMPGRLITDVIIASWPFSEGVGNKIFDLSGNGNTGTLQGNANFVVGMFGAGVDFDGLGDRVVVANDFTLSDELTVVIWAKRTAGDGVQYLADTSQVGGWFIRQALSLPYGLEFACYSGGAPGVTGNAPQLSTAYYQMIACTHGVTNKIYVDGLLEDSVASNPGIDGGANLVIGAEFNFANGFNGIIDHMIILSGDIAASSISQLRREPFCMYEDLPSAELLAAAAA